jgi:hypothetical protein
MAKFRTFSIVAAATQVVLASHLPARATEGGVSLFVPGLRGPLAGFVPPPGFYFQNDFFYYSGNLPGSGRTQFGGSVLTNVKQRSPVNFATPIWVTPLTVLGGNIGFSLTVPFGSPEVAAGALISAPRLGRTFAIAGRDQTFNVGDPVVGSFIGWHSGNFHWSTGVSLNVPAGAYREGRLSNVALNRWIGDVYGSLTYLDAAAGIEISTSAGFEINGENEATKYRSGNAFHADFAASQYLNKNLSIGFLASHYEQVTGDSGQGNGVGSFKGRVTAVGGTASYSFTWGGVPISTRIKVLKEVQSENRFKGTIALFTVSIPLGGKSPTSTATAQH